MAENEQQQSENQLQEVENNLPAQKEENAILISDNKILGYYEKAIQNIDADRSDAGEKFDVLFDEVINGGDATTASKEMATNFFKMKLEASDRMIKILDLWTRVKLREKNTMSDYQKARTNIKNQQNNINIQTNERTGTTGLIDMVDNIAESKNE